MRTLKFLGIAVALVAVASVAGAQANVPAGAFPGLDRLARLEARRLEQFQMRRFAGAGRMHMGAGMRRARGFAAGPRMGMRGFGNGPRAGVRVGARAGFRAGLRAGLRADATPELRAFAEAFSAQRQAVHSQVLEGKLTREQARAQLQQWVMEHRPKK